MEQTMAANPNFEELASTTRRYYASTKLTQQVFDGRPFLKWLMGNGRIKPWDGGDPIIEPILGDDNDTFQWQADLTEVDLRPQGGISAAQFSAKLSTATVVMSWPDMWRNAGRAKVIDIWQTKVDQAIESFATRLNRSFINGDGTNPLEPVGIVVMVDSTGTYGGINRATNPFWGAYEEGTAGPLDEADIRLMLNTASRNRLENGIDAFWTTPTLYSKYESMVLPQYHFTSRNQADIGLTGLSFRGVPLFWDNEIPSGTFFGLASKYIAVRPHSDANLKWSERVSPEKQLADSMFMYWFGNLTSSGPRYMGKLTGRTA